MHKSAGAIFSAVVLLTAVFFMYTPPESAYVRTPQVFVPLRAEILFGGDMLFDRTIRIAMEEKGDDYVLSCIAELLKSADLVIANLEGPITSYPSQSVGSEVGGEDNFTFTFPASTAGLLARHNIRLVNIGNNHIMNFGREGLFETKQWLDGAGVAYFGEPDFAEEERVERLTLRGIPLSFVNWSDWTPVRKPSTSNGAGELNLVVEQIRKEKDAGRMVVVYAHWGEEYQPPPPRVKQLARSFVDAGAVLVVGSHPHIVQESERYKGVHIYYSLGNMVFDQYWNEEVRRGLLLRVFLNPTGISSVEEIPIDNQIDRRTCAV